MSSGLRALLAAEVVSASGSATSGVALPWLVLTTTGSATTTGTVLATEVLPVVLLGLPAGALAERFGARRWMLASDAARAVLIGAIPLLHLAGRLSLPSLIGLVFAIGLFSAPYEASQQVLLADLVGEDENVLAGTTSLLQGATRLTLLIGPPAAGVLIAVMGAANVLLLDAGSYLAAVLLVGLGVRGRREASARPTRGVLGGVRALLADPLLSRWTAASAISEAAYQALFLAIPVLTLLRYHDPASLVGVLLGLFGTGALVGSLVSIRLTQSVPARTVAVVGKLGQAAAFVVLIPRLPVAVLGAALLVLGAANGLANGPSAAVRILRLAPALRPKALAANRTLLSVGWCAGMLAAGPALDRFGPIWTFAAMAVLQAVSAAMFYSGARRVAGSGGPGGEQRGAQALAVGR